MKVSLNFFEREEKIFFLFEIKKIRVSATSFWEKREGRKERKTQVFFTSTTLGILRLHYGFHHISAIKYVRSHTKFQIVLHSKFIENFITHSEKRTGIVCVLCHWRAACLRRHQTQLSFALSATEKSANFSKEFITFQQNRSKLAHLAYVWHARTTSPLCDVSSWSLNRKTLFSPLESVSTSSR